MHTADFTEELKRRCVRVRVRRELWSGQLASGHVLYAEGRSKIHKVNPETGRSLIFYVQPVDFERDFEVLEEAVAGPAKAPVAAEPLVVPEDEPKEEKE